MVGETVEQSGVVPELTFLDRLGVLFWVILLGNTQETK